MADEVTRRLVHASGSVVPGAYLAGLLSWTGVRYLLVVGVVGAVGLEVLRLGVGLDWRVFDRLTREYERDNPAGYALYVFSGSATGLLFEPRIAVPAILMLTLADPISGLASSGELRRVKRPSVLALMFGVCTAIAVPFVAVPAAALGGLGATFADGVKPTIRGYVVDDNLSIPVLAAAAMAAGITYLPTTPAL